MTLPAPTARDKPHRCLGASIRHSVWHSSRFPLSARDGQARLCTHGIDVTHAAIRHWGLQVGRNDAHSLRPRRPRPGDTWHVAAGFLPIPGKRHALWRAVDQDATGLDMLGQRRRHAQAPKKFVRKGRKGLTYVPRVIITDKRKSSGAAKRAMLPGVAHRQPRSLNNRAENSPQPTRQREWRMPRVTSPGHAQRFLAAYGPIAQHLRPRRHRFSAPAYRQERRRRFDTWRAITSLPTAA
jgi:putative transposase